MRNDDPFPLFLVLLAAFFLFDEEEKSTPMVNDENQQKVETIEPSPYTVSFDVWFESFYTGDQTSITYTGRQVYDRNIENIARSGLPVTGVFPEHTKLEFRRRDGALCALQVPTVKEDVVGSVIICEDINPIFVGATVEKGGSNLVHVSASPELIPSWCKRHSVC